MLWFDGAITFYPCFLSSLLATMAACILKTTSIDTQQRWTETELTHGISAPGIFFFATPISFESAMPNCLEPLPKLKERPRQRTLTRESGEIIVITSDREHRVFIFVVLLSCSNLQDFTAGQRKQTITMSRSLEG